MSEPSLTDEQREALHSLHATRINPTSDGCPICPDLRAVVAAMLADERAAREAAEAEAADWREKANEAGQSYALANSKHHAELDRANRLERLADTLAERAVDLEDRARAAEAKVRDLAAGIEALHVRETVTGALVEVEGGRATVSEDVDYCAECGSLDDPCPTLALVDDPAAALAEVRRCWRSECRTACYYPDVCSEAEGAGR